MGGNINTQGHFGNMKMPEPASPEAIGFINPGKLPAQHPGSTSIVMPGMVPPGTPLTCPYEGAVSSENAGY